MLACLRQGQKINSTANPLSSLRPLVQSVSDLLSIFQFLNDCKFCISNDDERYKVLVEPRNGVFLDASGI